MFHMGNKDSWIKTMPKLLVKIINCSPQFKVIRKIRGLDHRQIVALDNIHVHIGLVIILTHLINVPHGKQRLMNKNNA